MAIVRTTLANEIVWISEDHLGSTFDAPAVNQIDINVLVLQEFTAVAEHNSAGVFRRRRIRAVQCPIIESHAETNSRPAAVIVAVRIHVQDGAFLNRYAAARNNIHPRLEITQ